MVEKLLRPKKRAIRYGVMSPSLPRLKPVRRDPLASFTLLPELRNRVL